MVLVKDLIASLREMPQDAPVRFAYQSSYPLQDHVDSLVVVRTCENDRGHEVKYVFLRSEGQVYATPYAPEHIFDADGGAAYEAMGEREFVLEGEGDQLQARYQGANALLVEGMLLSRDCKKVSGTLVHQWKREVAIWQGDDLLVRVEALPLLGVHDAA